MHTCNTKRRSDTRLTGGNLKLAAAGSRGIGCSSMALRTGR